MDNGAITIGPWKAALHDFTYSKRFRVPRNSFTQSDDASPISTLAKRLAPPLSAVL